MLEVLVWIDIDEFKISVRIYIERLCFMNLRTLRRELLKQKDAAVFLGVSVSRLTKWQKNRIGPRPIILGSNRTYYFRSDLIFFIQNDDKLKTQYS